MAFLPANTVLGTTDEFKNVSFTVTYTQTVGGIGGIGGITTSYPVTITPIDINKTVTVDQNKITGYFSDSFDNLVYYRNKDDSFSTVSNFSDVNLDTYSDLVKYTASPVIYKTYSYRATANGQSQIYTIKVMNNWSNGKINMLKFLIGQKIIQGTGTEIIWTNINKQTVTWTNIAGSTIRWLNNQ